MSRSFRTRPSAEQADDREYVARPAGLPPQFILHPSSLILNSGRPARAPRDRWRQVTPRGPLPSSSRPHDDCHLGPLTGPAAPSKKRRPNSLPKSSYAKSYSRSPCPPNLAAHRSAPGALFRQPPVLRSGNESRRRPRPGPRGGVPFSSDNSLRQTLRADRRPKRPPRPVIVVARRPAVGAHELQAHRSGAGGVVLPRTTATPFCRSALRRPSGRRNNFFFLRRAGAVRRSAGRSATRKRAVDRLAPASAYASR